MPLVASRHNHGVLAPEVAAAAATAQIMGGEGFEPPAIRRGFGGVGSEAAQNAAHGWPGAVGEAGALGRHGARAPRQGSGGMGAAEGTRGNVEAHWAGGAGPAGGPGGSHGSSLAMTHALGPTEELTGATEFVSGGCHRCHRYRNKHGAETTMRLCVGFVDHPNNMHETTVITCEIVAEDIGEI